MKPPVCRRHYIKSCVLLAVDVVGAALTFKLTEIIFGFQYIAVVRHAVLKRGRHLRITKNLFPFAE